MADPSLCKSGNTCKNNIFNDGQEVSARMKKNMDLRTAF